jgi:hypothetical protein
MGVPKILAVIDEVSCDAGPEPCEFPPDPVLGEGKFFLLQERIKRTRKR